MSAQRRFKTNSMIVAATLEYWVEGRRSGFKDPAIEEKALERCALWLLSDARGLIPQFIEECVDREFAEDIRTRCNRIVVSRREARRVAA